MARRLDNGAIASGIPDAIIGREICRNCGGGIVLDGADHRSTRVPHRRVCRKCGEEYGTTVATLHPSRGEYSTVRRGFYPDER
jgi:hypothetical protein